MDIPPGQATASKYWKFKVSKFSCTQLVRDWPKDGLWDLGKVETGVDWEVKAEVGTVDDATGFEGDGCAVDCLSDGLSDGLIVDLSDGEVVG